MGNLLQMLNTLKVSFICTVLSLFCSSVLFEGKLF
uniref:Uncharacterized protein n=1 Tax=Anguilla anguilla TaxID=7936 RepID=A0A0E9TAC9_ANGAN